MGSEKVSYSARVTHVVLVALMAITCAFLLTSCSPAAPSLQDAPSQKTRLAGDAALPSLDGQYAYLLVQVVSKHESNKTVEVKTTPWQSAQPFPTGPIPPATTGSVLCSNLAFFPGGIHDGSTVVVSCLAEDAQDFPVTAYSIERVDEFQERVARWSSA